MIVALIAIATAFAVTCAAMAALMVLDRRTRGPRRTART